LGEDKGLGSRVTGTVTADRQLTKPQAAVYSPMVFPLNFGYNQHQWYELAFLPPFLPPGTTTGRGQWCTPDILSCCPNVL